MASDVIGVRLHLRQVRVLAVVVDTPGELRVRVESAVSRPRCPHCGFKCHRVHDIREREVRDLEVSGRPVTLVWMRRRMVCGNCASRWLEEHLEFDGRLTRRLAHRLVADAQVMTIRAVARRHGVSWSVINTLVRAWSGLIAEHRRSRRCSVLLVDETSLRLAPPLRDCHRQRRHQQDLGHDHPSQLGCADRVFDVTTTPLASRSQSRRHRRVSRLQGLPGRLFATSPPRVGPLPHDQMVLCGAHRGPPRHPTPP